jgi:hypothetical protein
MGSLEAYVNELAQVSQDLYNLNPGTIEVQLDTQANPAEPSSASVLVTQQRPFAAEQVVLNLDNGASVASELPAGTYSVVVFARGFDPYRTVITLAERQTTHVSAPLQRSNERPSSFGDRLAQYGLDPNVISLRDLFVPEGQTLILDSASAEFERDCQFLRLQTIDDCKRVLGNSDKYWPAGYARFGILPGAQPPSEMPEEITADLRTAGREYVYGNSEMVASWKAILNEQVALQGIDWAFFVFRTVTVGPHAVLTVKSSGLACDTLRVHASGTVNVVEGPSKIDIDVFEEFS